ARRPVERDLGTPRGGCRTPQRGRCRTRRGIPARGGVRRPCVSGGGGAGQARPRHASRRRSRAGGASLSVSSAKDGVGTSVRAGYPEDLRAMVEEFLGSLRFSSEPATAVLDEAMRYSLLAGGKRIRPVLTLATTRALGHDPAAMLPMASALELVHTYSLIHDDLPAMDDDDLRRGRPTCHIAFGEDVAILAGDGLFAEGFRLVLERQEGEPERILRALRELAGAISVVGMVGGQYIDVTMEGE